MDKSLILKEGDEESLCSLKRRAVFNKDNAFEEEDGVNDKESDGIVVCDPLRIAIAYVVCGK